MDTANSNLASALLSPAQFQYTANTAASTPQQEPIQQQQPPNLHVPVSFSQSTDHFPPSQALLQLMEKWAQEKLKQYMDTSVAKAHKEETYNKMTSHLTHETVSQDLNFKYKPWATAPKSIPANYILEAQLKEEAIIKKAKQDILMVREPLLKADLIEANKNLAKFSNKDELLRDLAALSPSLSSHNALLHNTVDTFFIMKDSTDTKRNASTSTRRHADTATPMATEPADPLIVLTEQVSKLTMELAEMRQQLHPKNQSGQGARPTTPSSNNQRGRSRTPNQAHPRSESNSRPSRQSFRSAPINRSRERSNTRPYLGQRSNGNNFHRNNNQQRGAQHSQTAPPRQARNRDTARARSRSTSRHRRSQDDDHDHGRANRAHQERGKRTQRERSKTRSKN